MTEAEFIRSIDCAFPYGSDAAWRPLVELGASISPNAAFMVLHEICRAPIDVAVAKPELETMLEYWHQHVKPPLVELVLPAAQALIEGEAMAVDVAIEAMRTISGYPGQYNALAIAYFACNDVDGKAEKLHLEITSAWAHA